MKTKLHNRILAVLLCVLLSLASFAVVGTAAEAVTLTPADTGVQAFTGKEITLEAGTYTGLALHMTDCVLRTNGAVTLDGAGYAGAALSIAGTFSATVDIDFINYNLFAGDAVPLFAINMTTQATFTDSEITIRDCSSSVDAAFDMAVVLGAGASLILDHSALDIGGIAVSAVFWCGEGATVAVNNNSMLYVHDLSDAFILSGETPYTLAANSNSEILFENNACGGVNLINAFCTVRINDSAFTIDGATGSIFLTNGNSLYADNADIRLTNIGYASAWCLYLDNETVMEYTDNVYSLYLYEMILTDSSVLYAHDNSRAGVCLYNIYVYYDDNGEYSVSDNSLFLSLSNNACTGANPDDTSHSLGVVRSAGEDCTVLVDATSGFYGTTIGEESAPLAVQAEAVAEGAAPNYGEVREIAVYAHGDGSISAPGSIQVERAGVPEMWLLPRTEEAEDYALTIVPAANYHVSDVSQYFAEGAAETLGATTLVVPAWTENGERLTLDIVFELNTTAITVTAGTNGTASLSGTEEVQLYDDYTVTFTPDAGYAVTGLTVNGVAVAAADSYTVPAFTAGTVDIAVKFGCKHETLDNGYCTLCGQNVGSYRCPYCDMYDDYMENGNPAMRTLIQFFHVIFHFIYTAIAAT